MCGRYATARLTWEQIVAMSTLTTLGIPPEPLREAYNVAPTQMAPIIASDREQHRCTLARFGLVPQWFRKPLEELKFATFNAKSEEVTEKASYRGPVKSQRCLIPVQHFYEWKGKGKPYAIGNKDETPMFFAGLWTNWAGMSKGEIVEFDSFTIMTTAANDFMQQIHKRMPVILQAEDYETWLTGETDETLAVAGQYPSQLMQAYPVGPAVGNVRNQGSELAASVGEAI
ncbi:SOS response-associated peptidase [Pelagibius sp. Alg239-R121]|uniref:SOS response-associated peptidase n=1 Tax=Pelagibius sp. Alg239-R121 TaxID=2993448 RepID=UPI0024A72A2C|nr:SOS response-associated peptidase [Pelagibius sp. Alg239-R121]